MNRGIAAGLSVIASLALVACGSSGGNTGAQSPASSGATSPSASPTPSIPPRNLKPQLLTVADLPEGWAVDNSSTSGQTSLPCMAKVTGGTKSLSKAVAHFVDGTDFPIFDEALAYYPSASVAVASYESGVRSLNTCTSIKITTGGTTYTGTMGAMSFAKVGQQSAAWQLTFTIQGYTVAFNMIVVRKGPEAAVLAYGDLGTPDLDTVTSLVTKAVAKMPAS